MSRIALAGFLHESNTFLPVPTTYEDFASTSLTVEDEVLDRWHGANHELGGMVDGAAAEGLTLEPLLATFAVPSGTLTAEAFERIADGILSRLAKSLPVDGLLVALHGATVAAEHPDADGEVLRRLRARLGPDVPIVATFDLHANVSRQMIANCNAAVIYRSNPHLDQRARGLEAAALMARILRGEVRPVQALETPPLLIRISRQYTAVEPARLLYDDVAEVRTWPGILSASAAMGFYYADVPEMGASFLAVADSDESLARKAAQWLARRAWERREEFAGGLPAPAQAIEQAAAAGRTPVTLMDVGDNVGGGSPGDSTVLLAELLRQGVTGAMVVLYDPEAVAQCTEAGVMQQVQLRVGAKTDRLHGDPVEIRGRVRILSDGLFEETQVRHGGWRFNDQGITAVVETEEQHTIVLTSRRMAPMSLEQVISLGIHPERKRVLVAKGVVAPRAAYEPVSAEVIAVDTPGVTADDPALFDYKHRRRPIYPLEPDAMY